MRRATRSLVLAGILCAGALAPGCAGVRPHERERLAHRAMQAPAWPARARADGHTFSVLEGSEPASIEAGRGCGCN